MLQRGIRFTSCLVTSALLVAMLAAGCGRSGSQQRGEAAGEAHSQGKGEREGGKESGGELAVEFSDEAIENAGIIVATAGPGEIEVAAQAPGEVQFNAERVLEVRPRYAGIIREIRKRVGDPVRQGEVVAIIESSESLTEYELHASMSGYVISRNVVTGQTVDREEALMRIADLSNVWVEFAVYPQFVGRIRTGMPVTITAQNRPELSASGRIQYVGPALEPGTRVSSARLVLPNPRRHWQPGLFVNARVVLDRSRAAVTVPNEAIVRSGAGPAVFRAEGHRFEMQTVTIGRSDRKLTEVRVGLAAGDSIVVRGAFVLKSELGKGEVEE